MSEPMLRVVVPASLRLFLHRGRSRDGAMDAGVVVVRIASNGRPSVGHVVQSIGVPLTEVETVRLDGAPVGPDASAPVAGTLEVVALKRPQATPTLPPRFVLDVHLGALARRMRLLGLDVAYRNDASDDDLLARSAAEQRVLLTRDRGLLRRRTARWAAYVRGQRLDEQFADVMGRFAPPLRPWTRCTLCNGLLQAVAVDEVADQLEPGTLRTYSNFVRCTGCGRAFWRGAHARRLEVVIASAAERARDSTSTLTSGG